MKKILFLVFVAAIAAVNVRAQEFTFTTTAANTVASKSTIDMPGLAGNPNAIIVATPTGNTATLNPHPIGAWYYNGKWNIFNTNHSTMPPGMTFRVRIFLNPGSDQFLHTVTKDNLIQGASFIDNPALNSNPGAQFSIFQNHASQNRAYNLDPNEATAVYNAAAGKWAIKNVNGKPLFPNTAYNIVISAPGAATNSISTVSAATTSVKQPGTPVRSSATTSQAPAPAFVGSKESIDRSAANTAKRINGPEENALPSLLTALQRAGFYVLDKKGEIQQYPESGRGQGLGIYRFEADGSLKLDKRGVKISLVKMAASITKDTPQISAAALAAAMLADLRKHAENTTNSDLRYWARLIIELGKSSTPAIDLMTAQPQDINLSVLQATLLTRRMQGDIHTIKVRLGIAGNRPNTVAPQSIFITAAWTRASPVVSQPTPCNLTGDQALILDAAAVGLTTGQGAFLGLFGDAVNESNYMTGLGKVSLGLSVVNIALAWGKLVAAVTALKGEITVEQPLPLKRTKDSVAGEKRLLTLRAWSEVGDVEVLNCVRPALNIATGLDFNMPTDGPLGDVLVEWEFSGENATNKASKKFVFFKPLPGASSRPNNQVTDDEGKSKIDLVGLPKVPGYSYLRSPMTVRKQADVLAAVRLKSSKDFVQNWIDIGGTVIGVVTGGPLGLIGAAAEIGYRVPITIAHKTVPVTDHEECDGRWFTLEYTATVKGNGHKPAGEDGSPEIIWSFDRLYEGNIGLFSRDVNVLPSQATTLESITAAIKAEERFLYNDARGTVNAEIDDRIETITKEVCTDKTNEETSVLETWKASGDFPVFGSERLLTEKLLHTYNVSIPVGSKDGKALRYARITRKGRSGGKRPSTEAEEPVTKFMGLLPLPTVLGIIKDGVVTHDPEKDIPQSFPREWVFDSGDMLPGKPLIKDVLESRSNVKIRVYYKFTFGCR